MKGKIFEIKRFAVHDGDGIRTTVFFKGCPLKCVWCHNPEGLLHDTQVAYYEHKCISCGSCVSACPNGAHAIKNGVHVFDRSKCKSCGKCAEVCFGEALKVYGKEVTVDEIVDEVLKDKDFYDNSGGGVTLSGGECLLQADFCAQVLKTLKGHNVNTAVDTCGFTTKSALDKVAPYTDVFLYDLKAVSEKTHINCTGQGNRNVIDNLRYLDDLGCKIEVRIPFVPNYNEEEIEDMAKLLASLKNLIKVRVLPYHNYAGSKYSALGFIDTLPKKLPTESQLEWARAVIKSALSENVLVD